MRLIKEIADEKIRTIAVDFDGTLCEREKFPAIGKPKQAMIDWLKAQKQNGKRLILWTCREGEDLKQAIEWSAEQGLTFDTHNENIPGFPVETRKVVADIYIDDRACVPIYDDKASEIEPCDDETKEEKEPLKGREQI